MFGSTITREFALAQAAVEHAVYFLELGADRRAAAYFQFASEHLQRMSHHLLRDKIDEAYRQPQIFPSAHNN